MKSTNKKVCRTFTESTRKQCRENSHNITVITHSLKTSITGKNETCQEKEEPCKKHKNGILKRYYSLTFRC
jgi:hypothetical protein